MSRAVTPGRVWTRGGRKRNGRSFCAEAVERRVLLAAVSWDAGGDGTNWTDPLNWSNNSLPQPVDDVTISVGANPTILIPSGTQSINSLVTDEAIRTTGGTLAVATTAQASQSVTLAGGGLSGGAWTFTGGASIAGTSSGGTLANVALTGGDLLLNAASASVLLSGTTSFPTARLQNNCTLQMATGYVLNSLVVAEGATAGTRSISMAVGGPGTVTVAPAAVIRLAAGCGGGLTFLNNSNATLVNNGLISAEAGGRTLTFQNNTFTNNATTQVSAGTLTINPTNWSNPGTITAASGTTLNFSGAWSNAGTLSVTSATLNLGGTFSTSGFNFAGFTRTGGTVNLTGTLNNAASTLTLDAATGTWNLSSATINNGTLNQTAGSILAITSGGGTLANVAVTGADLVLDTASATVLLSGTTSFPTARLQNNCTLQMAPGYVLNSLVVAEGATAGTRSISMAVGGPGTVTVAPAAVIRLAAGCGGGLTFLNNSNATLVNNGLISAEAGGRTLTFQNNTFTNNATTQVSAGTLTINPTNWSNPGTITAASGTTLNFSGAWSNAGTLSVTSATLNLGGTFSTSGFNFAGFTRTGGTVNLTGTLNNAASTLTLDAATGTWNLSSATINNGTLNQTAGSILAITSGGGTLANVAVTGADLVLDTASATVLLSGTTSFPTARLQNNCTLQMAPGYVLNSLVVAEGATAGTRSISMAVGGPGTVTVAPAAVIRLAAGCGGGLTFLNNSNATLVNNGLISAEAGGRTLTFQNNTFTNNATTQVSAGTLTINPTNWSNPGTITAASGTTLNFSGAWSNAGTLSVTSATLNLGGTFSTSGFNFAGFTRTGGTVNLTGTLNNAASTLTLDAATGTWNLSSATINNGTLNQTAGSILAITSGGGTLANVAVTGGDLLLSAASATVLITGSTSFPAARLQSNVTLQMAPGYVLNSLVVAEGAAASSRSISFAVGSPGTGTIGPSGVIRLAAGCGGGLNFLNSSNATVVNNGLITAEAAGRTLNIQTFAFSHTGTLNATAGTLSITPAFTNSGTITVGAGATFSTANALPNPGTLTTAGRVTIAGLLDIQAGSTATALPGGTAVIRCSSIAIAANHVLELNDNDLIIDYTGPSPIAAVESQVASAYNVIGDWSGDGITSGVAAADGNFTLAIADNAQLAAPFGSSQGGPLFSGQDVDLTTVLVKFTHRADVDLDGVITPNDSAIFGGNYSEGDFANWAIGDMDYDGVFTPTDAAIFGGFYDESLPPI